MNVRSLAGWGIAIYAVLYLVWSGLVIHGLSNNPLSRVVTLATLVAIAAIATRSLRLTTTSDVFPYALGWVVIAGVLDAVFAVPYSGWGIYSDWNLWVGYVLLFFIPLIVASVSRRRVSM